MPIYWATLSFVKIDLVKTILTIFCVIHSICKKKSIRETPIYWATLSFVKIDLVKTILYLRRKWISIRRFHTYCPVTIKFGIIVLRLMLLLILEFLWNRLALSCVRTLCKTNLRKGPQFWSLQTSSINTKFSALLICKSDVWFTVHRNSVWIRKPTRCHFLYSLFLF